MAKRQLHMVWPEGLLKSPPEVVIPDGYSLRQFRDDDEEAYLALTHAAGFLKWTHKRLEQIRRAVLPNGFYVIEHAETGKLVTTAMARHGASAMYPYGAELGWVAGRPEHGGKGLGLAVCAAVTRRFLDVDYTSIHILTDDWRLPAVKIYLKLGYVPHLISWDMEDRWQSVCKKLAWPFTPADWPRVNDAFFVTREQDEVEGQAMWRETTKHERNKKIFDEELNDFLPKKILDFHVHVMGEGVIPEGKKYSCGGHPMAKYDMDDLKQDLKDVYPGRETRAVCFGFPNETYNQQVNDAYVAEHCDGKRFFPFRLFDPVNDKPAEVRKEIEAMGFLGLKPYLNYVRKEDPNDVEIAEMLPDWIMEIVNDLELIVMLHIPRKQRLADPLNQKQVVELCERYPKAKIVLAHVGRAYFVKNVVGYLEDLKGLPNLWYDLAMVMNPDVLEHVFLTVPHEKILYATDIPIAVAPGKSVEINDQYTYITPVPWNLSISDDHKKLVFTSFLYEELRGIKTAVERAGLGREFVEGIFFENGMRLLGKG